MSRLTDDFKNELSTIIPDVRDGIRNRMEEDVERALIDERDNNIAIASIAMMDGGLSDEEIIRLLQKYWDLRLSEAQDFLDYAHKKYKK